MEREDWIIVAVAFSLFAVCMLLEWRFWERRGEKKYLLRDSLVNYSLVAMQLLCGVIGKSLFILTALENVRSWGPGLIPDGWWTGIVLFLGVDLGFYLFHRASHRVRFLWAIHESHHSSPRMNFSVALRQPPLEPWVDWPFFIGLAWVGFSAKAILTMYAFNLFYQFFIHTEMVGRLPRWVEAIWNTPSHHRVHHGTNPAYIDTNYGGVLIIWDRLLGTFAEEREPVRYGVLHPVHSHHPLTVGFHLWREIARDLRKARGWRERFSLLLAPPGWADAWRRARAL